MKPEPPVTVAVLTYNRSRFLRDCLLAIQNQSFTDFVVYILDNASSDDTESVVFPFLRDGRFNYKRHTVNITAAGNYNFAFGLATSGYLCVTHDDDIMDRDFLKVLVAKMEAQPDANLIYCNTNAIDSENNIVQKGFFSNLFGLQEDKTIESREFLDLYIQSRMNVPTPATLIRSAVLASSGLRFEPKAGPAMDTLFWTKLNYLPGTFQYHQEALYNYRLHAEQDSSRSRVYLMLKLYRPMLFFVLGQGDYKLARAWKKKIATGIFLDWTRLAYENAGNSAILSSLGLTRDEMGTVLWVLFRGIPKSPAGRRFFYKAVVMNYQRFRKLLGKLRTFAGRGRR